MSTDEWRAQLQKILDPQPAEEPENALLAILDEFIQILNQSEWVHAEIRRGSLARTRTLFTGPKVRRDISSPMLTFALEDGGLRVVGSQELVLREAEQVRSFLLDFMKNTAFRQTVAEYRALCESDTPGELRGAVQDSLVTNLMTGAKEPGFVKLDIRVPPASQRKLADKWRSRYDQAFEIDFRLENAGDEKDARTLALPGRLESGGFTLRVIGIDPVTAGVFRAHGKVDVP